MILEISKWILIFSGIWLSACGSTNIFNEFADKEEDKAIFFDAQLAIDDQDYTSAINLMLTLSDDYLARRNVKFTLASAYAGRCGLNFVNLANEFTNMGSTLLFRMLMGAYNGAADANIADCTSAESTINSVAALTSERDAEENLFAAFVALTKIGVILSRYADTDDDDTPDAGFDACDSDDLPDASARQLGVSLASALLSLSATGSDIGGDAVTDVQAICAQSPGGADLTFLCSAVTADSLTADQVKLIRTIVGANEYLGIGSCANTLVNCICL